MPSFRVGSPSELWVGTDKGLDRFGGRHFTHFSPNPKDPAGLPDPCALPVLLDQHGMLSIATTTMDLVCFDTNTRLSTTYLLDPKHPRSQGSSWTEDIDVDGTVMWVASPTGLLGATGNREVRSGSGGPGGWLARRRREAPWCWASTDDAAARRRPVVASRSSLRARPLGSAPQSDVDLR
jgi:hypothetical protein